MIKRYIAMLLALLLLASTFSGLGISAAEGKSAESRIDNSGLMPKWVPDSEVTIDSNNTPDWIDNLIIGAMHIQTATDEGTLKAAIKVLDFYRETGINGIWLTPVYDPGETGNGYGNLGPHTIDPAITRTEDYEQGWKELKSFIDEAHKRDIRIILDVISWGTVKESELYKEHPEWYSGAEVWGGFAFNWKNEDFCDWYVSEVVDIAMKTGCDGFRYDVEPEYAGYEIDGKIKNILLEKGRKLLTIGEKPNERGGVYDIEQSGIGGFGDGYSSVNHYLLENFNIVDSIKDGKNIGSPASQDLGLAGTYRYYTNAISCHDNQYYQVQGKRVAIGYQAIFSPFIPLWYLGEEWNNSRDADLSEKGNVLYFNDTHWDELEKSENRALYEDIKAMIRIRRSYPEIFSVYGEEFKNSNICKVNVAGCEGAQPYARYAGDTAFLIVPNYNVHDKAADMTVYMPFNATGLDHYKSYTVTDAETGEVIVKGSAGKVAKFTVKVPYEDQRVFKVEASGKLEIKEEISHDGIINFTPDNTEITEAESSESEPQETYEVVQIKKKKKKKASEDEFPILAVAICAAAVVAAAGGVTAFVVIKRKKRK